MGDGVAGGLVAGHDQQDEERRQLLVGELLAVDLGVDQRGDQVVAPGSGCGRSASSVTIAARSWPACMIAMITGLGRLLRHVLGVEEAEDAGSCESKISRSWLRGMPMRSTMTRSGSRAATSVTKSHSPCAATASTISAALRLDVAAEPGQHARA